MPIRHGHVHSGSAVVSADAQLEHMVIFRRRCAVRNGLPSADDDYRHRQWHCAGKRYAAGIYG